MIRLLAVVDAGALPGERTTRLGRLDLVFTPGEIAPATEAALRAHDAAVRGLLERVDALLPARFGLVLPEEELLRRLAPRAPALAAALDGVRGKEQVTVRVLGDTPPPPTSGTEFLRSRARVPGLEVIRALAGDLVLGERLRPGGRAPVLGSVYHLVPRGAASAYRARVHGRHAGRELSARGPFPPYAFTEVE